MALADGDNATLELEAVQNYSYLKATMGSTFIA